MKSFWTIARLTTYGAAILVIGYRGALFSSPAYGQEKTAADQKANESFDTVRKAAEKGDADAQFKLGVLYYKGRGVPQDHAEAVRWYRKGAGQESSLSDTQIQDCLRDPRGTRCHSARQQIQSDWRSRVGPLLTPDQIDSFLSMAALPSGLYLQDSQQALGNAANDLNTQNPWLRAGNHTGFAVWLYEPKAWLGAKKEIATRRFQTYREEDVPEDDRFQVLRIIVRPDTAEYLTAWGAANATNVDHVVLRSIDKAQVAQPVYLEPTTEEFWSALGGRAAFAGLFAIFSMADVERIRSASPNREFLVTIIGTRKRSNRDFRVKQRFFARLGD